MNKMQRNRAPERAVSTGQAAGRQTSILIEGWRGVNHSFALVNQCQILELLKIDGVRLFHRDMPFAMPHWNRVDNDAGFPADDRRRIDALAEPGDEKVDCIYRICSPFRAGTSSDPDCRALTFMVTELGLSSGSFDASVTDKGYFTRDNNLIVTPTAWSRERIMDYGFSADRIKVIPHGVNASIFCPLSEDERLQSRRNLGIGPDEIVFLNLGVSTWNKGVDVLLLAFAQLRSMGYAVRLILKDQRALYGISVEQVIKDVSSRYPALFGQDTVAAISLVSMNLSQPQLRLLYGTADCYVSPYRAEGFNLPVLEAIACGTPVIVTAGGATDDFCNDDVALRVPGDRGSRPDPAGDQLCCFIEPHLPELVDAMEAVACRRGIDAGRFAAGRERVLSEFSWSRAAEQLLALARGESAAAASPAPVRAESVIPVSSSSLLLPGKRDEVAVVIPVFKTSLSEAEFFALKHSLQFLEGHAKVFMCPQSLNLDYYRTHFPDIAYCQFDDRHFKSVRTYSRLLVSAAFYERFLRHEFILILQPDAILFSDQLAQWVNSPYDYIGAPWPGGTEVNVNCGRFAGAYRRSFRPRVGNGGLSLRRVRACLDLIDELPELRQMYELSGDAEDLFFGVGAEISERFIVPNEFVAARFAIEGAPEYYTAVNGCLPFGAHAWMLYREFWKNHLPLDEMPAGA